MSVVRRLRKDGFTVRTRKQWGTQHAGVYARRRRDMPVSLPVKRAFLHITVTDPSGDFDADMRTLERIGMERFGSGVSYNYVVHMETGQIGIGQPVDAKGTHTVNEKDVAGYEYNLNYYGHAIALLGMPGDKLSDKAQRAVAAILRAEKAEAVLTKPHTWDPHSLFAWKDCPTDAGRDAMPAILRMSDAGSRVTKVAKARALLRDALARARRSNKGRRAAKISKALETLPKE